MGVSVLVGVLVGVAVEVGVAVIVGVLVGVDVEVLVAVGVVVGVRLLGAVADEDDHAPIRRPGRTVVLVVTGSDLYGGLGLEVIDIKMGAQTIQITHIVFLELQPVDHPGPWVLLLAPLLIADQEHESFPVGRPLVALDALLDTGELDALPAA